MFSIQTVFLMLQITWCCKASYYILHFEPYSGGSPVPQKKQGLQSSARFQERHHKKIYLTEKENYVHLIFSLLFSF